MTRAAVLALVALSAAMPALAAERWQTYQRGPAVELAVDAASFSYEGKLLKFAHREVFQKEQKDPSFNVRFYTRKNIALVDCDRDVYTFISSDFLDRDGKVVWATMFPLPDYLRKFHTVPDGSVAAAMIDTACSLAGHPAHQN